MPAFSPGNCVGNLPDDTEKHSGLFPTTEEGWKVSTLTGPQLVVGISPGIGRGDKVQELASKTAIKPGSERSFGLVFCAAFLAIGLWPLLSIGDVRWWAIVLAAMFCAAALILPVVLRPLNLVWFRFGMLLHAIISPLTLGLIFFAVVVPTGYLLRLFKKDVLDMAPGASERVSYWIKRDASAPTADSMRNQF